MKNITIKGFEHYLIDKNGIVYNSIQNNGFGGLQIRKEPRELKSWPNQKTGYMQAFLCNKLLSPKLKGVYVHRLVALAYLPNPLNLPEVNHKDFDKTNNKLENLEWVTKEQNTHHTNRYKKWDGGKLYNSILNNKNLLKEGIDLYKKYGRLNDIAKYWKVSITIAKKVFTSLNIETYKGKQNIPPYIKNEIKEMFINDNTLKAADMNYHLLKKHKITFTRQALNYIKKNSIMFQNS
jgi:hypothetical protein